MFTDITEVVVELLHIQLSGFGIQFIFSLFFYICIEIHCKHEVGE